MTTIDRSTELAALDEVVEPPAVRLGGRRINPWRAGLLISILVLLWFVPDLVDPFWLGLLTQTFVWMLGTLSVIVLYRASTAVSLCQASFMGVAANAATWFSLERGWATGWALLVGALVAVPAGLLLVLPALRLRGLELTVLTLTVTIAVDALVFAGGAPFRAGEFGLFLQQREVLGIDFGDRESAYHASLVVAGACLLAVILVLRSNIGRTWRAVESGNAVAAASGISLVRVKVVGFGLAALIAGLAGSLLLVVQGSADANSFNAAVSIRMVVTAMIGGIGAPLSSITGGLANSVGLRLPSEFGLEGDWLDFALGALVIAIILRRGQATEAKHA